MARQVAVVTDSTSYLPTEMAAEHGIVKVPVQVIISGKCYLEGVDISTEEVAQALREWKPVSTSRPSPAAFAEVYDKLAAEGAEEIVSAHLSSDLSGTYQTALLASKESPVPVRAVDSRSLAMSLGFACISGAEAAEGGGDADVVARTILGRATRSHIYFYVDTLEYLKRGGRMSSTAAAFGGAMRIKPILHLKDGRVEMLEKARTSGKALARLTDLAMSAIHAAGNDVDVAVHHIDALDRADELAWYIGERVPGINIVRSEIGAVVGAHVGPGVVAVVVAPRSW